VLADRIDRLRNPVPERAGVELGGCQRLEEFLADSRKRQADRPRDRRHKHLERLRVVDHRTMEAPVPAIRMVCIVDVERAHFTTLDGCRDLSIVIMEQQPVLGAVENCLLKHLPSHR